MNLLLKFSKRVLHSLSFLFLLTFSSFAQTQDSTSYDVLPTPHPVPRTPDYTSVHYRGSAMISINEQFQTCQINFVNVIDSFLYIHLNVAGLEIGRVLAKPDSFLLINKLQRNFYQGDYSFFENLVGLEVDFYTIQAIFNRFPVSIPEDLELSYQGENEGYPFYQTLICESEDYELKIEVKKITFNSAPKVSAVVPKGYNEILFYEER